MRKTRKIVRIKKVRKKSMMLPNRKPRKVKTSVYQKEGRQDGRSFQGRGHGDTPGLGESGVTDDSFIGLAYEKTDKAATDGCQEYAEYCLI